MDKTKYTLTEHLAELRRRLIYCLIFFGIFSALSWRATPQVISFISAPVGKLVFLHPTEAFLTYMKVSLWSGFFLASPIILYHLWRFVESALLPKEKKYTLLFVPFSFLLFLVGLAFGLFLAVPLATKFLVGFGSGWATPMLSINNYVSFVMWLLLAFGASFELPLIIFFLAKLKVVTPKSLSKYRRHAILLIFIAAAIITPTPDVFTQLLLVGPLLLLYELGLLLARFA